MRAVTICRRRRTNRIAVGTHTSPRQDAAADATTDASTREASIVSPASQESSSLHPRRLSPAPTLIAMARPRARTPSAPRTPAHERNEAHPQPRVTCRCTECLAQQATGGEKKQHMPLPVLPVLPSPMQIAPLEPRLQSVVPNCPALASCRTQSCASKRETLGPMLARSMESRGESPC